MAFIKLTGSKGRKARINIDQIVLYCGYSPVPADKDDNDDDNYKSTLITKDDVQSDGRYHATETPEEIDALIKSAIILKGELMQPTPDQDDRRKGFQA